MTGLIRRLIRLRNRWNRNYARTGKPKHKVIRNQHRTLLKYEIKLAKQKHEATVKDEGNAHCCYSEHFLWPEQLKIHTYLTEKIPFHVASLQELLKMKPHRLTECAISYVFNFSSDDVQIFDRRSGFKGFRSQYIAILPEFKINVHVG